MTSDIPKMSDPLKWQINMPQIKPIPSQSELAVSALSRKILNFEKTLDNEHELGFRLVTAGTGLTFYAERIGAVSGQSIEFFGVNEEGEKMSLIQHLSQMSIHYVH